MNRGNSYMIRTQIQSQGINNNDLLKAMEDVDRGLFVPAEYQSAAYNDCPLPIGYGQTISQPYIVAYMIDAISPSKDDKALEIGSGSGYLSCILSRMVKSVFGLEIIAPLLNKSQEIVNDLKINNISFYNKNGHHGLPEFAPYDIIIVSCAIKEVPAALINQLAPKGRMIIPLEESVFYQNLVLFCKKEDNSVFRTNLLPVRFVPFVKEDSRI